MGSWPLLREGFETVVFLLAVAQSSQSSALALTGALLGIAIAGGIGYGVYRGGVRLNMARFFKVTGAVLVVVAAGPRHVDPAHGRGRAAGSRSVRRLR